MEIEGDKIVQGYAVAPFLRTANLHAFNRYAAVNDEFIDIHMDDQAGRAAGYPGAIGMGSLTYAWMHCLLRDWMGEHGRIVRLDCQFRRPAMRGDTVLCKASVTRAYEEGGVTMADLDVWTENQRGELTTPATATVAFQPDGES